MGGLKCIIVITFNKLLWPKFEARTFSAHTICSPYYLPPFLTQFVVRVWRDTFLVEMTECWLFCWTLSNIIFSTALVDTSIVVTRRFSRESMYCFMDSQLPRKERTVCCAEWSIFQRFASYFWSTPGVNIGASPFSHLDDISKISQSRGSRLVLYAYLVLYVYTYL